MYVVIPYFSGFWLLLSYLGANDSSVNLKRRLVELNFRSDDDLDYSLKEK